MFTFFCHVRVSRKHVRIVWFYPGQTSDQEILDVTSDIWNAAEAAGTFFSDTECQYDVNAGPGSFFTYVDETRLQSHTYGPHVDLLDNYITVTGTEDPCDLSCEGERSDYLDLLTATDAMNLAREFLGARSKWRCCYPLGSWSVIELSIRLHNSAWETQDLRFKWRCLNFCLKRSFTKF